jgi:hypothetical protein
MLSASNTGSSLPNCESRNSAMLTWPVDTARSMSGCLMSEPFECTTMSSRPSVAFFTSSAKDLTLRVWNSPSEYGVGMSHLVCACAAPNTAAAAASNAMRAIIVPPPVWSRILA